MRHFTHLHQIPFYHMACLRHFASLHKNSKSDYLLRLFLHETENKHTTLKQMNNKMIYPTRLAKSGIHGTGVFSKKRIPARKKIGSMSGIIISTRKANAKAKSQQLLKLVELGNGKVLDGSVNGNDLTHVNHSCSPNSYIRVFGEHVEFYALKTIRPDEEITCSYGESYHEGKKRCGCGAEGCVGYI